MSLFFKTLNTSQLNEVQREILKACREGGAVVNVRTETISSKCFRALHLWFRQVESELNAKGVPCIGAISGKPGKWHEGDFKAKVYKPFLRSYKGMKSTKDQGSGTVNECMEALSGHLGGQLSEYNVIMPPFPSLENMSLASLLKG